MKIWDPPTIAIITNTALLWHWGSSQSSGNSILTYLDYRPISVCAVGAEIFDHYFIIIISWVVRLKLFTLMHILLNIHYWSPCRKCTTAAIYSIEGWTCGFKNCFVSLLHVMYFGFEPRFYPKQNIDVLNHGAYHYCCHPQQWRLDLRLQELLCEPTPAMYFWIRTQVLS